LYPLLISTTIKDSNFKFGTKLGAGSIVSEATFWTKIGRALG